MTCRGNPLVRVLCSEATAGRVSLEGSQTFVGATSHKVTEPQTLLSAWGRACVHVLFLASQYHYGLLVSAWGAKVSTVKVSVN